MSEIAALTEEVNTLTDRQNRLNACNAEREWSKRSVLKPFDS